jgi:hypothetical protein
LIPSLYLQDIVLILLLSVIVCNKVTIIGLSTFIKGIKQNSIFKKSSLFYLYILFLIVVSAFSQSFDSAIIIITRFLLLYLCGVSLIKIYSKYKLYSLITPPLILSIVFQTVVGLYQYINQSSVFGYLFLGESDLTSYHIAKTNIRGLLEVAPYGTTPHPNILAGFIVVAFLILLHRTPLIVHKIQFKAVLVVLISLILVTITLTSSLSALSGLIIALVIMIYPKIVSTHKSATPLQVLMVSAQLLSLLVIQLGYHSKTLADNQSFIERYELNNTTFQIIANNPPWGTGINSVIHYLPDYPLGRQTSFLLQPPHHVGLLLLAETGVVGITMMLYLFHLWFKETDHLNAPISAFLPLIALTVISGLDHYPLTLPTGQHLLMLVLVLPLLKPNTPQRTI